MFKRFRRLKLDINKIREKYINGLSANKIAMEMGCSGETILRRLKAMNITIKKGYRPSNYINNLNNEMIKKLYCKNKMSAEQIGRKLKVHPDTVRNRLKAMKIPRRGMSESRKLSFTKREKLNLKKRNLIKGYKPPHFNCNNLSKEKREEFLRHVLKGLIKRPTSLEKQMIDIIKRNNLPYKYTGNGSFLIGFKNPDFININGEKKLIEVGNVFHHQGNYIKERSEHFAKYGWKSLIFIGNTLNEKEILSKLI